MRGRRVATLAFPVALLVAIVAAVAWAVSAPLYREYSRAECLEAYGKARNISETRRVDLHPYRNEADPRRIRHRCGEIRTTGDSVLLRLPLR